MAEVAPILSAKGVTVTFGGVDVVAGVDLDLRPGEIHALVGENGAGKSTLGRIIAGVFPPDSGKLVLRGTPVSFTSPRQAITCWSAWR
ncbi:MAG TPA: ATP-binding cassette domain-containing protein, partial [Fimbriimonadaceae bacterium]|nr:ATP-binding cassette domain-containing protein [Fimbriimonadaceae bacterium]